MRKDTLRLWRKTHSLTVKQAAMLLKVNSSTYNHWEMGDTIVPAAVEHIFASPEMLSKLILVRKAQTLFNPDVSEVYVLRNELGEDVFSSSQAWRVVQEMDEYMDEDRITGVSNHYDIIRREGEITCEAII